MTAGQRNCYLAIEDEADKYSIEDALFAMREVIRDRRDDRGAGDRDAYDDAMFHIDRAIVSFGRAEGGAA